MKKYFLLILLTGCVTEHNPSTTIVDNNIKECINPPPTVYNQDLSIKTKLGRSTGSFDFETEYKNEIKKLESSNKPLESFKELNYSLCFDYLKGNIPKEMYLQLYNDNFKKILEQDKQASKYIQADEKIQHNKMILENRVNLDITDFSIANWIDNSKYLQVHLTVNKNEAIIKNIELYYAARKIPLSQPDEYKNITNLSVTPQESLTYPITKTSEILTALNIKNRTIYQVSSGGYLNLIGDNRRDMLTLKLSYHNPITDADTQMSYNFFIYSTI